MREPIFPPEEARVGQCAVVNCSPEYEEHVLFEKFHSKLNNSRWKGLFFPTGKAEEGGMGFALVQN